MNGFAKDGDEMDSKEKLWQKLSAYLEKNLSQLKGASLTDTRKCHNHPSGFSNPQKRHIDETN